MDSTVSVAINLHFHRVRGCAKAEENTVKRNKSSNAKIHAKQTMIRVSHACHQGDQSVL